VHPTINIDVIGGDRLHETSENALVLRSPWRPVSVDRRSSDAHLSAHLNVQRGPASSGGSGNSWRRRNQGRFHGTASQLLLGNAGEGNHYLPRSVSAMYWES